MIIGKEYHFDAAHYLPNHPKCGTLHGHTWTLEVSLTHNEPDKTRRANPNGMLLDFHELNYIVQTEILSQLDHRNLNDILPFIPSCENLVTWMRQRIAEGIPEGFYVWGIKLREGKGGWAEV